MKWVMNVFNLYSYLEIHQMGPEFRPRSTLAVAKAPAPEVGKYHDVEVDLTFSENEGQAPLTAMLFPKNAGGVIQQHRDLQIWTPRRKQLAKIAGEMAPPFIASEWKQKDYLIYTQSYDIRNDRIYLDSERADMCLRDMIGFDDGMTEAHMATILKKVSLLRFGAYELNFGR
jgi:hypothetical protein